MSEIDPRADAPLVDWSDLGVSGLLPTGTVTLLLADVEGSKRLWETQAEVMTGPIARFNQVVCDVVAAHDGVRPVEQGEGDSFVAAFARASDAVSAALGVAAGPFGEQHGQSTRGAERQDHRAAAPAHKPRPSARAAKSASQGQKG